MEERRGEGSEDRGWHLNVPLGELELLLKLLDEYALCGHWGEAGEGEGRRWYVRQEPGACEARMGVGAGAGAGNGRVPMSSRDISFLATVLRAVANLRCASLPLALISLASSLVAPR
jgi:hypothetical protein